MSRGLLIGIDGGGTHSSAVAVWPDGRIAAVAREGGMNFHNDGVDAVRRRLENVVGALCAGAGAPAERICAGLSALDGPADRETLAVFASDTWPAGTLDLQSDAYIALMGCTLGSPGMIVICGTGSMLLLLDREEPTDTDLAEAAAIAAYHSKGSASSNVPVDYTKVRHVKKPSGAKPGMVIFTHNKTLYVDPKLPDPAL